MTELKLTVPDSLAKEAAKLGLLKPKALEQLLRKALRRRSVNELFEAMDRMSTVKGPVLTGDEIQVEIDAVRAARRARRR